MVVADTNVVSELMRSDPSAEVLAWLGRRPARELFLTAVTEDARVHAAASNPFLAKRASAKDRPLRHASIAPRFRVLPGPYAASAHPVACMSLPAFRVGNRAIIAPFFCSARRNS